MIDPIVELRDASDFADNFSRDLKVVPLDLAESLIRDQREAVALWKQAVEHYHMSRRDGTDQCAKCGLDIRNEIHIRT